MAKASNKSPEEKLCVVLSVLRGELSVAAAGRRVGCDVEAAVGGEARPVAGVGADPADRAGAPARARSRTDPRPVHLSGRASRVR